MIEYPNFLNKIFDKLDNNGAKSIIIGGFVRDYLLNIKSDDIDIEIYNISSFEELEYILKEFGSVNSVGKSFGVCKLKVQNFTLDFTLPRTDSKIASGHSGFDIKIQKNLDFVDATRRRDFSMNAIGYDVVNKTILDPFNGINDLNEKNLKMVDAETFVEDPLRVLRAVQFCSRFNLVMDKELFVLCKSMIDDNLLSQLAKERIYQEIKKNLLKSKKPSLGFELLKKIGALKYFSHLEFMQEDEWSRSMNAIDKIARLKTTNKRDKEVLMLASICYIFSSSQIEDFIFVLSNDKSLLNTIIKLQDNLKTIINICSKEIKDYELYKLATKVNIEELILLSEALFGVGNCILIRVKELNILNKKIPHILLGRDLIKLGMSPSSKFSIILDLAYEAQMNGEFFSKDAALRWLSNYLTTNNIHLSL
ncbi:CCA tRNA nucleotidyltransferase [Sulfurimonas sp.]|uniref:CCA tRNA nucleotidyltransferase n=1 Tax=Sulfurimonas sp. TaxID=2022749 RepID=UPI0025F0B7A9|nr:CCA tRNA nucleotidyltransferase [Sulfurimonas sp.]